MPGNLLAILCAMVWSLAVILMKKSGARIHPLALNLGKNIFGLVLLLASCFIVDGHLHIADAKTMGLLLLSGFLGIGVADGLILRAMQHLHASHVAILECLFAPYVIGLSMLFLNEHPSPMMLKYLQATTAALLNQTSTAFTVLFAMIFLKERLNKRKLIAIFLAMSGVAVITLAS
ncbi:MAG: DMT family transporter [Proteobacteria bacterium]|nr:DMT family transporter [Pseudomonadota bacterium]